MINIKYYWGKGRKVLDWLKSRKKPIFILIILSLIPTIILYWPVIIIKKIDNLSLTLGNDLKRLDFPLNKEIQEILNNWIKLPIDKFQLCLKNSNRVYLVHADNESFNIEFKTDYVDQRPDMKKDNVGAMNLELYYNNGREEAAEEFSIYKKIGDPLGECNVLYRKELSQYASSTIEYRGVMLGTMTQLNIKEKDPILIGRIVGGSNIVTNKSFVIIMPRWYLFLSVWLSVALLLRAVVGLLCLKNNKK